MKWLRRLWRELAERLRPRILTEQELETRVKKNLQEQGKDRFIYH